MLFITKDRELPIDDLTIMDDLSTYHNTISFSSFCKIFAIEGKIKTDRTTTDVCIVNQQSTGSGVRVECVTKKVHDAFNSVTEGYVGWTDVNGLFRKLGFEYKSDYKSNNVYFSIDKCMVTTLFDDITKYASFANGGSAHFYMNGDGVVCGYDYKLIKEKARVKQLSASVTNEVMDTAWIDFTPSEYELHIWGADNSFKTERLVLEKGFGKAVAIVNDTTGVWKDALKQELINGFYNKWYTSRTVTVGIAPENMNEAYNVGDLVRLNDYDNEVFIVRATSVGVSQLSEVPVLTATLISEPVI